MAKRFNIIDVLILCFLLGVILVGAYKLFFVNKAVTVQNSEIEYQILIEEVRKPTVEAFQEGQAVKEAKSNTNLGKIVKKEVLPCQKEVPTADGRIVLAPAPGKFNVLLTLRSPAVVSDQNIMIDSVEVKIGTRVRVKTRLAASSGVIYGISSRQ